MHAQDRGTALVRRDRGGDAGGERPGCCVRITEDSPERALSREPDEHRPAERRQHVEPSYELEVVPHGLAETDARVETDAVFTDAGIDGEAQPLLEKRSHLRR